MRGLLAGAAKVIRVTSNGLAEVPEPEAIDDGACGQWVRGTGDPLGESGAPSFDGFSELDGIEDRKDARFHFGGGRERIAATEDGGLFELAVLHPIARHAQRLVNIHHRDGDAVVHAECIGLVAFHLPLQALEAFAGHAFVAEILRLEADQFRRELILWQALLREDLPSGAKDIGEPLFGILAAPLFCLSNSSVPFGRVAFLFSEPFLGVAQQFRIKTLQNSHVLGPTSLEVLFLIEASGVFLFQKRC